MADELDDVEGFRPKRGDWPGSVWINVVLIGVGLLALIGFTADLIRVRRPAALEWLLVWDMGSWWWVGQLVVIVGWCAIVYASAQSLMRSRRHKTPTK
ncbi:hypothetical protein Aph01nite_15390 [Acrocarpospora phusangensis]|uniref:Uncharacterized protein n=1 Tax=Acrocarpospora phusangensis TaxID=1070424 RepID=A0A919Q8M9_9ACTN|nr:hypothetical protein [Acrocarpospora phusangensis]GIH23229.1 hypothetical protein Aph01nite_15390 [Acrocarpospora phusangensis]